MIVDQRVQSIFEKKLSANKLEAASLVASTVTYLIFSFQLPRSFQLGAALFYLAYKAAQFYLSRKAPPPDSSTAQKKPSLLNPYTPEGMLETNQMLYSTVTSTSPVSLYVNTGSSRHSSNTPYQAEQTPTPSATVSTATEPEYNNEPPESNHEGQLHQQSSPSAANSSTTVTEQKNDSLEPNHRNAETSTIALPAIISASTQTVTSPPAALPSEEAPEQKAAADQLTFDIEAELQGASRLKEIIKPFTKSQIMSLQAQLKSNSTPAGGQKKLKAKNIKVKIRFGDTHVFKMGKQQVESLNRKGFTMTEKTLFFWIDIADGEERFPTNFIPLMMLDNLKTNSKQFSLCLTEKNYQWTLTFKDNQLARLKSFEDTIRKCRKVEVIHTGIVRSSDLASASKIDSHGTLLDNDLAAMNRLSCYIVPFKNG